MKRDQNASGTLGAQPHPTLPHYYFSSMHSFNTCNDDDNNKRRASLDSTTTDNVLHEPHDDLHFGHPASAGAFSYLDSPSPVDSSASQHSSSPSFRPLLLPRHISPSPDDFQSNKTWHQPSHWTSSSSNDLVMSTLPLEEPKPLNHMDVDPVSSWLFDSMIRHPADEGVAASRDFRELHGDEGGSSSISSSGSTSIPSSGSLSSLFGKSADGSDNLSMHPHPSNIFNDVRRTDEVFVKLESPVFEPSALFSGLSADMNMFQASAEQNACVRPQDLMGSLDTFDPTHATSEQMAPDDSHWSFPTISTALPLNAESVQEPSEHPDGHHHNDTFFDIANIAHEDLTKMIDFALQQAHPGLPIHGSYPESAPIGTFGAEEIEFLVQRDLQHVVEQTHEHERMPFTDKTGLTLNEEAVADAPAEPRKRIEVPEYDSTMPLHDVIFSSNHLGVCVEDVAMKTAFFRATNPGERLSDELLFNFAGRLSQYGEPIPGYRCYILDCTKATKRKDHMADHVRTHLGEKPFHCSICGLGFIRNNDCQRHENNHRPDKRFVCDCKAAFSRRDLYVRHQKTACSFTMTGMRKASSAAARRKKKKNGSDGAGSSFRKTSEDPDFRPNYGGYY